MERKIHFRETWLIFLGIWGEAELILRIWGAKEKYLRELRDFLSGVWGDHCIIFRDQGSTYPPGGLCDVYCDFVTFPFGIPGQVRCLIVSIPDTCCLSYFAYHIQKL